MRAIEKRVTALEQTGPVALSPLVKQWLGQPLTEAERAALDDDRAGIDPEFDETALADMDAETRAWLMQ